MITNVLHAIQVQTRRREAGLKGRSKAVRRWAKRVSGASLDSHLSFTTPSEREGLRGDFIGCRPHDETHL